MNEPRRLWDLHPERWETARSVEDVRQLVRQASARRQALLPVGGGRSLGSAGRPAAADLVVDLRGLAGVVELTPGDLTVVARAGTPLPELRRALAAKHLTLPGTESGEGTLGGLLASGYTAPDAGVLDGSLSERVLGLAAVDGEGGLSWSGGRVVKNVAGYDLHRAHAGAGGALGIVTEIALRLEPRPETRAAVRVVLESLEEAREAWSWLRRSGPEPLAVRLAPAEGPTAPGAVAGAATGPVELVGYLCGDREVVGEALQALRLGWGTRGEASVMPSEESLPLESEAACGEALALAVGVRPREVFGAVDDLLRSAREARVALRWTAWPERGVVRADALGDGADLWKRVAEAARRGRWHYRVENEGGADAEAGAAAEALPAWSAEPEALRLLARWKAAVDPQGVLRPGSYSRERLEAAAIYFAPLAVPATGVPA